MVTGEMPRKRILVVENNEFHRQLISEQLEQEGYAVEIAPDGETAVIKVRINCPDLVVLDLEPKTQDGIETIRTLLRDFPDLRIVIHSAYSHYKTNFVTWGARAYVLKSSNPALLINEVNRVAGTDCIIA